VKAFGGPSSESISAVPNCFTTSGVPPESITTNGPFDDWLSFTVPIDTADSLFDTSFESFVHEASGEQMIRTLEYSIPVDLQGHIDLVHPTTTFVKKIRSIPQISFPAPLPPSNETLEERALGAPSSCNSSLYGIPATRATQSSNKLGVSGFIEQFANMADLRTFLANLRPDLPSTTTFALQTLDGGQNPQGANQAGIEANLDIQYTVGVASGVPVTLVTVGENNGDGVDGFLDIINFLNGHSAPPQVWTTSYGFDERYLGSSRVTRFCNAYSDLLCHV
ncbi:hypothetical protein MPER_00656, partial [Moniliophthora perniciosa FA553]